MNAIAKLQYLLEMGRRDDKGDFEPDVQAEIDELDRQIESDEQQNDKR